MDVDSRSECSSDSILIKVFSPSSNDYQSLRLNLIPALLYYVPSYYPWTFNKFEIIQTATCLEISLDASSFGEEVWTLIYCLYRLGLKNSSDWQECQEDVPSIVDGASCPCTNVSVNLTEFNGRSETETEIFDDIYVSITDLSNDSCMLLMEILPDMKLDHCMQVNHCIMNKGVLYGIRDPPSLKVVEKCILANKAIKMPMLSLTHHLKNVQRALTHPFICARRLKDLRSLGRGNVAIPVVVPEDCAEWLQKNGNLMPKIMEILEDLCDPLRKKEIRILRESIRIGFRTSFQGVEGAKPPESAADMLKLTDNPLIEEVPTPVRSVCLELVLSPLHVFSMVGSRPQLPRCYQRSTWKLPAFAQNRIRAGSSKEELELVAVQEEGLQMAVAVGSLLCACIDLYERKRVSGEEEGDSLMPRPEGSYKEIITIDGVKWPNKGCLREFEIDLQEIDSFLDPHRASAMTSGGDVRKEVENILAEGGGEDIDSEGDEYTDMDDSEQEEITKLMEQTGDALKNLMKGGSSLFQEDDGAFERSLTESRQQMGLNPLDALTNLKHDGAKSS